MISKKHIIVSVFALFKLKRKISLQKINMVNSGYYSYFKLRATQLKMKKAAKKHKKVSVKILW
jgi:hypothetical protein